MARDPPVPDRADLDQPDLGLCRRACAGHAALLLSAPGGGREPPPGDIILCSLFFFGSVQVNLKSAAATALSLLRQRIAPSARVLGRVKFHDGTTLKSCEPWNTF